MKVTDHLKEKQAISFEIIPPMRGRSIKPVMETVEKLAVYEPPFIDVTSHAASEEYVQVDESLQRRVMKKRPGTLSICAVIQNAFDIDAVAHVLCDGFSPQETEDFLIDLDYAGLKNILALKGDGSPKPELNGRYASDLVSQVSAMNAGDYLTASGEGTDFCIGVAAYPEKHFSAPNLRTDLQYLKQKVALGAEYAVTQMFFDNEKYFSFVEMARNEGIDIPIIPGLKVVTSEKQLRSIPSMFFTDIPYELSHAISEMPNKASSIGVDWTVRQAQELLEGGAPGVHFYVMLNATPTLEVVHQLR